MNAMFPLKKLYFTSKKDEFDIVEHPNQDKYSGQRVFIIDNNTYLIPFVETEREVFLKTIIPSRKATKKYLGDK